MFFHPALPAFTVLFLCMQHSHGLSLAPPSLWCDNAELANEWGVKDACDRYIKASYGKPITITLLYESLCYACNALITKTLPMIQEQFDGFVNLEFIPFGNTKILENGTFECQHGKKECEGDVISVCALGYINKMRLNKFKFIVCFESNYLTSNDTNGVIDKCSQVVGGGRRLSGRIKQCYKGSEGKHFIQEASIRTKAVQPEKHKFVPWIVVNGVSVKGAQLYATNSWVLSEALCNWYNGEERPAICNLIGTMEKNDQLYAIHKL